MKNVSSDSSQTLRRGEVFQGLLQQLHDANRRFHDAPLHWEQAMRDTRYDIRSAWSRASGKFAMPSGSWR